MDTLAPPSIELSSTMRSVGHIDGVRFCRHRLRCSRYTTVEFKSHVRFTIKRTVKKKDNSRGNFLIFPRNYFPDELDFKSPVRLGRARRRNGLKSHPIRFPRLSRTRKTPPRCDVCKISYVRRDNAEPTGALPRDSRIFLAHVSF